MADYQIPDRPPFGFAAFVKRQQFIKDLNQFFTDEKVLAVIDHRPRHCRRRHRVRPVRWLLQNGRDHHRPSTHHGFRALDSHRAPAAAEKRCLSRTERHQTLSTTTIPCSTTPSPNPGTDKKDELVMLGAHLDSWHAGTGATDNGAGTIVMMEAMRILKALQYPTAPHHPHRSVERRKKRVCSARQGYVEHHFGSRPHMDTDRA